jgi:chemotaxis protein MotB
MAGKGGAWKVAFADFMTAMMAFFLVMWLTAQDKEILVATAQYFQTPFKSPLESKAGLLNFDSKSALKSESGSNSEDGEKNGAPPSSAETIDLQFLNSVAKDVYKLLNMDDALAQKPIDVQVTSDGLRITLYDRAAQPFFEDRSAKFTKWGDFVMQSLAWTIERHPFTLVIEGHTRRGLTFDDENYGGWELSADRANSARRALIRYAVAPEQIERVTGYADTRPVPLSATDSETNHRVTISLRLGTTIRPSLASPAPPPPTAGPTSPSPPASSTQPARQP